MFHVPQILTTAELSELRDLAMRAPRLDGRVTAGASAAQQKRNQQVDEMTDDGRAIAPSIRVHYVAPVTRGARLGVVFWIQKSSS